MNRSPKSTNTTFCVPPVLFVFVFFFWWSLSSVFLTDNDVRPHLTAAVGPTRLLSFSTHRVRDSSPKRLVKDVRELYPRGSEWTKPSLVQNRKHTSIKPKPPSWMTDYFLWHRQQRAMLNETNWENERFLVVRCLYLDDKCGGASDRMKMIPFSILVASKLNRLLFIKWERPAPLEEFLVPPEGGMDWRLPTWLEDNFEFGRNAFIIADHHVDGYLESNRTFLDMRYQLANHGSDYYNSQLAEGEPDFQEIYHFCWSKLFQPSLPVATLIERHSRQLQLTPGEYVSVHIRSLYRKDRSGSRRSVTNAIHCGWLLQPGLPIYVSSDSETVTQQAVQYGEEQGSTVVARTGGKPPLHLDRGSKFLSAEGANWQDFNASDYYDTFVDLYLLAQSRCIARNIGGFGTWASLVGANHHCSINHGRTKCT